MLKPDPQACPVMPPPQTPATFMKKTVFRGLLLAALAIRVPGVAARATGGRVKDWRAGKLPTPSTGSLPQTYRVTLAIVDKKRPEWIISQFAAGVVRPVTAENGGKFSEVWNGLDDNFIPRAAGNLWLEGNLYALPRSGRGWPASLHHAAVSAHPQRRLAGGTGANQRRPSW